jgi:hypothetical protein
MALRATKVDENPRGAWLDSQTVASAPGVVAYWVFDGAPRLGLDSSVEADVAQTLVFAAPRLVSALCLSQVTLRTMVHWYT